MRDMPEAAGQELRESRYVDKNALPHAIDNIRRVLDARMIVDTFMRLQTYSERTRVKLARFEVRQRIRVKKRVLRAAGILRA